MNNSQAPAIRGDQVENQPEVASAGGICIDGGRSGVCGGAVGFVGRVALTAFTEQGSRVPVLGRVGTTLAETLSNSAELAESSAPSCSPHSPRSAVRSIPHPN